MKFIIGTILTILCYWVLGKIKVRIFGNYNNKSNYIQEEFKSRFNSGSACYHSVENVLSFHLLSDNVEVTILSVVFMGVKFRLLL
jgi:hypothetical protein